MAGACLFIDVYPAWSVGWVGGWVVDRLVDQMHAYRTYSTYLHVLSP